MAMRKSVLADRVGRLIAEGKRPVCDPTDYIQELKELVEETVDEKTVRRSSRVFKALSEPSRLRIIRLVAVRDLCVCEIMAALDMTQPTASHHLNILEGAGLLRVRREGKWTFYGIAEPDLVDLIERIGKG